MTVFVKNNTVNVQVWNGKQFQPSEYRELNQKIQVDFQLDPKVIAAIISGDIIIATSKDGLGDLSNKDGETFLKNSRLQSLQDINQALTGENGLPFTQIISSSYMTVVMIPYQGSLLEGPIKSVQIIARLQPTGETGSARLYDGTNGLVIAEGKNIIDNTAGPFAIYDLGPVSNVPLKPSLLKVQVKSSGGNKKFKIGYVKLKK